MNKRNYKKNIQERIDQKSIVLNGKGFFPKKLIIIESGKTLVYRIVRTKQGKYQLNR